MCSRCPEAGSFAGDRQRMRNGHGAHRRRTLPVILALLVLASCKREERRFREAPPAATALSGIRIGDLTPGPSRLADTLVGPYSENAYAIAQGQRLFSWYNCTGCHSHGGGGMGPPLMDDQWIYGSEPQNIFATIVEGRPNGMPSFRGKIPNQQVWQLVAYVRSMSGLAPKGARSGRSDEMLVKTPEQSISPERPKRSFTPPQSEQP
jgi:cytochrome c oxidase cbb3-type subunit III